MAILLNLVKKKSQCNISFIQIVSEIDPVVERMVMFYKHNVSIRHLPTVKHE